MLAGRAMAAAAAGGGDFSPIGVVFNGSTYLTASSLTGQADSKKFTLSAWVKMASDSGAHRQIISNGGTGSTWGFFNVEIYPSYLLMGDVDTGGFPRLSYLSSAGACAVADGWRHLLISVDMASASTRHVYIDDGSFGGSYGVYHNANLEFTPPVRWSIGIGWSLTQTFYGSMAELWFAPGQYLDLSVEANRRKFLSPAGAPVNLGSDGSAPTGVAPLIYMGGENATVANWHQNKGSGGNNFSVTGTLTQDSTAPAVAS